MPTASQIAFASLKGMTADLADSILAVVGTEDDFFAMPESDLRMLAKSSHQIFSASYRSSVLEKAKYEVENLEKNHIKAYYFKDSSFPMRFGTASDAPLLVYSVGSCDLNAKRVVSIVGTRHATNYGMDMCREIVRGIKEKTGDDVVVVSGLAYGIDIAAHKAALDCGLPTVAVLAHGLDLIYPAAHRSYAVDIVRSGGALVSEYPSGTRIHRSNFLARNRIIAALSDCTLVVESAKTGGALVTANIASSYGREVFACPGRASDEYSCGCNSLIRKNIAALVESADDLIDYMQWARKKTVPVQKELFMELSPDEKELCEVVKGHDFMGVGEISAQLQLPVHKVMSMLIGLEFKGIMQSLPGNRVRLLKNHNALW